MPGEARDGAWAARALEKSERVFQTPLRTHAAAAWMKPELRLDEYIGIWMRGGIYLPPRARNALPALEAATVFQCRWAAQSWRCMRTLDDKISVTVSLKATETYYVVLGTVSELDLSNYAVWVIHNANVHKLVLQLIPTAKETPAIGTSFPGVILVNQATWAKRSEASPTKRHSYKARGRQEKLTGSALGGKIFSFAGLESNTRQAWAGIDHSSGWNANVGIEAEQLTPNKQTYVAALDNFSSVSELGLVLPVHPRQEHLSPDTIDNHIIHITNSPACRRETPHRGQDLMRLSELSSFRDSKGRAI
ncbi:hypothetical protein C8J57DRAFT_1614245 [Mycena rebaudengoi]|nr:hypothetical protein C8J57DRAFT_1614245 [Mycena rebaudengoi]